MLSNHRGESYYNSWLPLIRENGKLIQHMILDDLSAEQIRNLNMAATLNGGFQYVKEQTRELCLAAVNLDGFNLAYVKEQTHEICLAAVRNYGCALQYVKNKTEEICDAALENDPNALEFIDLPTYQQCLSAIKRDSYCICYVPESMQTEELCLIAATTCNNALEHIYNQTEQICLAAVEYNAWQLYQVDDKTLDICKAACLSINPIDLDSILEAVPEEYKEECSNIDKRYLLTKRAK